MREVERPEGRPEPGVLQRPRGSKIPTTTLLREVDEYFAAGASVSPGDTVVDVGANVGAFSLRVAERCQSDVTLLCFEPSPATCRALTANFGKNALLGKTRHFIHQVGLGSRKEAGQERAFYNFRHFPSNSTFDLANKRRECEMFFEDRARRLGDWFARVIPTPRSGAGARLERMTSPFWKGSAWWWITRKYLGVESGKARIETLDEVLRRERIARVDLLKIDVEGPELEVLQGLGPRTWPLVRQVVMETHNRDGRQSVIEDLCRANGLTDIRARVQTSVDNGLKTILLLASRPN
jgi:FkbM family methyltransferase